MVSVSDGEIRPAGGEEGLKKRVIGPTDCTAGPTFEKGVQNRITLAAPSGQRESITGPRETVGNGTPRRQHDLD